ESGRERATQFAAGHDVHAGAELAEYLEHTAARVGLERIVNPMPDRREHLIETLVPVADRRGAVHVDRRADLAHDALERHALTLERAVDARETGRQYALAHSASTKASPLAPYFAPHFKHDVGGSADWNSSSGRQRIVALVSSLICDSH